MYGKDMIVHGLIRKRHCIKGVITFLNHIFDRNIKAKLNLPSDATKIDLINAAGVDTSKWATKFDLASLKSKLDKIGVGKLNTVVVD